ncbi:MAG: hypothetical protein H7240_10525 [Glaciimonas sp.]|nr:hypothetical protein [Glaciimonas sp.]
MPNPDVQFPALAYIDRHDDNSNISRPGATVIVIGNWQVNTLTRPGVMRSLQSTLKKLATRTQQAGLHWDLSQINAIDHIGAQLLWNTWGKTRPVGLTIGRQQRDFSSD